MQKDKKKFPTNDKLLTVVFVKTYSLRNSYLTRYFNFLVIRKQKQYFYIKRKMQSVY